MGIDLERARERCKNPATLEKTTARYVTQGDAAYFRYRRIPYKRWSPNADAIFRELAFAVVSGIHIQEASQTKPTLTEVKCPEDKLGNVDFSKEVNGAVSCDITGQNLDQVSKLRLRNAQDATDSKTAEADVTVSGDSTSGKVSLLLTQVGVLEKPAYKVYTVTKAGVEDGGGQTLHFDVVDPYVAVDPNKPLEVDVAKLDPTTKSSNVTITGYHLDKVSKVTFTSADLTQGKSPADDATVTKPTATSASFAFKPSDDLVKAFSAKTSTVTVTATLDTSNATKPDPSRTATIKVSNSAKLTVSPTPLAFDKQTVKTSSKAKPITISNPDTVPVSMTFKITGDQSADFKSSGACDLLVKKGAQCPVDPNGKITIDVVFAPTAKGERKATLSITESTGATLNVTVSGTGQ